MMSSRRGKRQSEIKRNTFTKGWRISACGAAEAGEAPPTRRGRWRREWPEPVEPGQAQSRGPRGTGTEDLRLETLP